MNHKQRRILIGEDDIHNLNLLINIVHNNRDLLGNCDIFTCEDGMRAYSMIELMHMTHERSQAFDEGMQKGFDIVILDQNLKHKTLGTSVYDKLRSDMRFRSLPVLFTTGNDILPELEQNYKSDLEMNIVMAARKPYDSGEIIRAMLTLMR